MGLIRTLKNYNVFNEGNSWLGEVAEIQLPKLAIKTEEWRGGGMLGPVDLDMGLEKMEMEMKTGGFMVQALRQFGAVRVDGVLLRFAGAYQDDSDGGVMAAELVVRGRHTEIDPGTAKAGDANQWAIKSALAYLKWTVAGRTEMEIDLLNAVFVVDGVDRMREIRAAMGIF